MAVFVNTYPMYLVNDLHPATETSSPVTQRRLRSDTSPAQPGLNSLLLPLPQLAVGRSSLAARVFLGPVYHVRLAFSVGL